MRGTFHLLLIFSLLAVVAGSISMSISCSPGDDVISGIPSGNACPAVVVERGDDFNMVIGSDTKREKPLIDINAPVDVETATFALG